MATKKRAGGAANRRRRGLVDVLTSVPLEVRQALPLAAALAKQPSVAAWTALVLEQQARLTIEQAGLAWPGKPEKDDDSP